ncbi:MAG: DUF1415 domain-containing protein, partial [Saprospiraceae bacterium]
MNNQVYIESVQKWVEQFIIQLNICPFARKVSVQKRIRYAVQPADDLDKVMEAFLNELQLLERLPSEDTDTTLFILPNALAEFEDFLSFVDVAEGFLAELGYEGIFQIATFHPNYQFAGTNETDAENFTNRAPFPILHILREKSMERALENYPNPEEIPNKNIALMNKMGIEKLKIL